ncbi:MAG: polysaccharide biosynthesis C-terminal domain-containing protein [Geodermatophilaceae bacterium]
MSGTERTRLDAGAATATAAPDLMPTDGGARSRANLGGLARGGALSLIGSGLSALAGVLVVLVLTRALPPAAAGTFFAVTSVFLLGQAVAKLGTNVSLVYFISRFRSLGVPERIGVTLRSAFGPVAVASTLIGVATFAVAPWLAELVVGEPSSEATAAVRVLALLVPVAAVADTAVSATRGFDTVRPTVVLDRIGRSGLQVVTVVVAVLLGWRTAGLLAAAWALPYLLPAVLGLRDLRRRHRAATEAGSGQPVDTGVTTPPFWRFTWPRALAGVAQIALQRLDIVLVAAMLGPVSAAVYTAASRVLVAGQLSNQAISNAVQARLGELLARDDVAAANTAYRASTAWLVLLNWPLYLLLALFAPMVLRVFGPEYDGGTSVVIILSGAMLLASACGMVNLVLVTAGRTTWNLGNAVLALGINIAANLILIPVLGIAGAAIAWALAIVVSNVVALAQIYFTKGLHPFGRGTLIAMGLAVACFAVIPDVAVLLWGGAAATLLVATAIGIAAYVAACYRLRAPLAIDELRRRSGARRGASAAR